MRLIKYTGVTLVYACPTENGINAIQKSYITSAKNFKELRKSIEGLIENPSKDVVKYHCQYIGINDVFEINGSLRQGAILGRVVLWSYKNVKAAEKLIVSPDKFWINLNKQKIAKKFIAEIVFLLASPAQYADRRTIICNVLVEANNKKEVLENAIEMGKSQKLKEILFGTLLQYEPKLINGLVFVGIANVKFVYDNVSVGKCFEAVHKEVRNVSKVRKLVFPLTKFSDYKF